MALFGSLSIEANVDCPRVGPKNEKHIQFTDVNPRIGTGGHGHVFLGANVPFGYVQLGPTEHTRGWDWCSGYHDSDNVLIGFGHQHLSGTGIGDLGDIALLPVTRRDQSEVVFSQVDESIDFGCYSVTLRENGSEQACTSMNSLYIKTPCCCAWIWARASDGTHQKMS